VREDSFFLPGDAGPGPGGAPSAVPGGAGRRRSSAESPSPPPGISAAVAATGFGRSRRGSHGASPSPQPHAHGALPPLKTRSSGGAHSSTGDAKKTTKRADKVASPIMFIIAHREL
jgi:hypothetical protein